jgi:glycerol-3-phosphate acyltransferase PlsY
MFVWLGWNDWPDFMFGVVGASIVWFAHHDNIGRLLRGEERKFDLFSRGD